MTSRIFGHMRRFLSVSATLAFLGVVMSGGVQAQTPVERRVVSSAEELRVALAAGRQPVALLPGVYDLIRIENLAAGTAVVITAADPARPPTIRRMIVTGSSDVVIDRLSFAPVDGEGSLLEITRSARVDVRRARFTGSNDLAVDRRFRALSVEEVDGIGVSDSYFELVERAIVLSRVRRGVVAHNDFRKLGAGAIDFYASSDIAIQSNRFGGFRPDAARVGSFIRAFTRGAGLPTAGIRIRHNVILQDTSAIADGVMLTNEDRLPYADIEIADNIIVSAGPHAITVDSGTNIRVERNVVLETETSTFNGAIRMLRVIEGTMQGNMATAYALVDSQRVARGMNMTIPRRDVRARKNYLKRITDGLATTVDSRIQASRSVTAEHRASGPRT